MYGLSHCAQGIYLYLPILSHKVAVQQQRSSYMSPHIHIKTIVKFSGYV